LEAGREAGCREAGCRQAGVVLIESCESSTVFLLCNLVTYWRHISL